MIGNITNGSGGRGVLDYVMGKEKDAELIGGTMAGETPRELASEFKATREMKPDATKPIKHFSLSLPPGERLESDKWREISTEYMKGMGFERSQWVAVRHSDKEHDHIHIVASRIRPDGSLIRDFQDRVKSQEVLRGIEREHGLPVQANSKDRDIQAKQSTHGEAKYDERTGRNEASTRKELQKIISEEMKGNPTMTEFVSKLENRGVSVKANVQGTGRISGISFQIKDRVMKGSDLGKSFTAAGIQKAVSYDPKRDLSALNVNPSRETEAPKPGSEQPEPQKTESVKRENRQTESKPEMQRAQGTYKTKEVDWERKFASKEAWDEAKAYREAIYKVGQDAKEKQGNLSAELKAVVAGRKALTKERWETVKPLKGVARKDEWAKFESKIQKQTEKIQTIKLDMAVTRADTTTNRMVLMESRYRAELRAVNASFEKGSKWHSKAMEKAGTNFLREAKGYAETLRKGIEGRINKAEKAKRAPEFYAFKTAQKVETVRGIGNVAKEILKGGWKALANQAAEAKDLYRAGKAALTEKTPEAWQLFQVALKDTKEAFKYDLGEARAAVKEARSLMVERLKDKAEQTRGEGFVMRAERVIKQTQEQGGAPDVGDGRREGRGKDHNESTPERRGSEGRPEPGRGSHPGTGADAGQRAGEPREPGGTAAPGQRGTPERDSNSRPGGNAARGGDAGRGGDSDRRGPEAHHGESTKIQREPSEPGGREGDMDRGQGRGGLDQAAARGTQGRNAGREAPGERSTGSRDKGLGQGREGGSPGGHAVPHRGLDATDPNPANRGNDRVEGGHATPGADSAPLRYEGPSRPASTKWEETLKQFADELKTGPEKVASKPQEPSRQPNGKMDPERKASLATRVDAANQALQRLGLKTPFSKDGLKEVSPESVDKALKVYEKAGLLSANPDPKQMAKVNREQGQFLEAKKDGPILDFLNKFKDDRSR